MTKEGSNSYSKKMLYDKKNTLQYIKSYQLSIQNHLSLVNTSPC